jgi:hypothetical protein
MLPSSGLANLRSMSFIGDLERFLATNLYPSRLPIAVACIIIVAGLFLIGRKRGWGAAAHRHRGRTGAVLVLALAVGVPTAWYLGSPLLIRTSLEEPAPAQLAAASQSPAVAATTRPVTLPTPGEPTASPAPTLAAPLSGPFHGADEFHFGRGTATLIETAPGSWTVRFDGFSVRNGPDLYVYLSPDPLGYSDAAIEMGRLKASDGSFNMDVPAGSDVAAAASVVIWCKQFAVQFAVASLGG